VAAKAVPNTASNCIRCSSTIPTVAAKLQGVDRSNNDREESRYCIRPHIHLEVARKYSVLSEVRRVRRTQKLVMMTEAATAEVNIQMLIVRARSPDVKSYRDRCQGMLKKQGMIYSA
jgi:hypothetical protein